MYTFFLSIVVQALHVKIPLTNVWKWFATRQKGLRVMAAANILTKKLKNWSIYKKNGCLESYVSN